MHPFAKAGTHGAAVIAGLLVAWLPAHAQDAPLSHVATPGVYKVLQENDRFRVVLATWKPGERDEFHSHPANATYALTPCHARLYGPEGKVLGETQRLAGSANLQPHIPSHSFENIGSNECQILIVERK